MLSRVADSIYWLNRYIERAENVARFIDVNLHLMLDLPAGTTEQWAPLVDTTGDEELFQERYGEATRENVVAFLTFDMAQSQLDLRLLTGGTRQCAFRARDHLVGNVGAGEHVLPDGTRRRGPGARHGRTPRLLYRGEDGQPSVCWYHRCHLVPQ